MYKSFQSIRNFILPPSLYINILSNVMMIQWPMGIILLVDLSHLNVAISLAHAS